MTCPQETFSEMMGPSVLRDGDFLVFAVSAFLLSLGYLVPFLYVKERARELGLLDSTISDFNGTSTTMSDTSDDNGGGSSDRGALLISAIGLGSTLGRLLIGFVSPSIKHHPMMMHLQVNLTILFFPH